MCDHQLLYDTFSTIRGTISASKGHIFTNGYLLRYIHLFFIQVPFYFDPSFNIDNYLSFIFDPEEVFVSDTDSDSSDTESIPETDVDEIKF